MEKTELRKLARALASLLAGGNVYAAAIHLFRIHRKPGFAAALRQVRKMAAQSRS